MKYIVFNINNHDVPILFPEFIGHDDMALMIGKQALSAGFCSPCDTEITLANGDSVKEWEVWGRSVSLNLGRFPTDAELIAKAVAFRG